MNVKLLFLWKCFLTFLLSISSIDSFSSFLLPVPIKYKGDPFLLEPEMVVAKEGEKYDTVLVCFFFFCFGAKKRLSISFNGKNSRLLFLSPSTGRNLAGEKKEEVKKSI